VVSIALFAVMKPLRAFLLTYVIGLLFLPVEITQGDAATGSIVISQSLRIQKFVACNLGALIGTAIFAPHIFRRYRFHWIDAAFLVMVLGRFVASVVNDLGPKDGGTVAFEVIRDYLPVILLSRMYLTGVGEVHQAMRAIVGGAFVYVAVCLFEFKMSPQLHFWTYQYYQHDFLQQIRGDNWFRPLGFLRHGIEVSLFMGTSFAVATWLWYKNLFKPLWGMVPVQVVVISVGVGLMTTLTVSGIAESMLVLGLLAMFVATRSRFVLVVLPIASVLWMVGRYTDAIDRPMLHRAAGMVVSGERISSLDYRLLTEETNLAAMGGKFIFGKGTQNGFVRDSDGKMMALDAQWLIQIMFFGLVGISAWYLVWAGCIYETFMRWRNLTPDLKTISALVCLLIGVQFVDFLFNSFPSMFLLMLDAGVISMLQRYRPVKAQRRVVAVVPEQGVAGPEMVMP
jgi:hypothetical protein